MASGDFVGVISYVLIGIVQAVDLAKHDIGRVEQKPQIRTSYEHQRKKQLHVWVIAPLFRRCKHVRFGLFNH